MSFPLSKLISMIKSTAKKKGIAVVTTEGSYTSLACFYDGDMPEKGVEFSGIRFTRSLYRTREWRMVNADINAALNIYKKCSPKAERLRCMGITCPRRLQVMNPWLLSTTTWSKPKKVSLKRHLMFNYFLNCKSSFANNPPTYALFSIKAILVFNETPLVNSHSLANKKGVTALPVIFCFSIWRKASWI